MQAYNSQLDVPVRLLIVQIDAAINVGNRCRVKLSYISHVPLSAYTHAARIEQVHCPFRIHCSGGPAFDDKGNVVGIAFLKQVVAGIAPVMPAARAKNFSRAGRTAELATVLGAAAS